MLILKLSLLYDFKINKFYTDTQKMTIYFKIALPLPTDTLYTYSAESDDNDICIGKRAIVPFTSRLLTGVIVETSNDKPNFNVKSIKELLDEKPVFTENMLKFTKWIADYYMCSWGEVLKAALPQGLSPQSIQRAVLLKTYSDDELETLRKKAPKRASVYEIIAKSQTPVSISRIEVLCQSDSVMPQLDILEEAGIIKLERNIEGKQSAKFQKTYRLSNELIDDESMLGDILSQLKKRSAKQFTVLTFVVGAYYDGIEFVSSNDFEDKTSASAALKALETKGILVCLMQEIDRSRSNEDGLALKNESLLQMTEEQEKCADAVKKSVSEEIFKAFLLHGVTGSGKTLVYINAISHTVALGKKALLMVPEIALTPQLIDRFEKVFPGRISTLHSRMSNGEKFDAWRNILHGKSDIVIGARSALFAPIQNLGLIIVDEEHESSYKQDSPSPRYHGRDCALVRAKYESAVVLLGSATPSIESYYNALSGKYELLEIKSRADGAVMPAIDVIDTHSERKSKRMKYSFSLDFLSKMAEKLAARDGIIIFQNKRGYSAYLECPDCAHIPMCENCAVSLTYYKNQNQLRCHYCGYTVYTTKACGKCGCKEMEIVGAGTQRIEDELTQCFNENGIEASIERMDLDTTSGKGKHRAMLKRFLDGTTDILLGTQMVAKGLDFARVTLVGVVSADIQLFLPDFRAEEKTYQLLSQVSGRAGRSGKNKGEVLIQTNHPQNPAVRYAKDNLYSQFAEYELNNRLQALYPPFTGFNLIEFSGEYENMAVKASEIFRKSLPKHPALIVLGPAAPSIEKIRNVHRRIIIIKNIKSLDPAGKLLRAALKTALDVYKQKSTPGVKLTIDIDSFSGV